MQPTNSGGAPRGVTRTRATWTRPLSDIREATEPDLAKKYGTPICQGYGTKVSIESIYSNPNIPSASIPRRRSSQKLQKRGSRGSGISFAPSLALPPPTGSGHSLRNRAHSHSPVRGAAARHTRLSTDTVRRPPSRTFVRSFRPDDILAFPHYKHPRIRIDVRVAAPLFTGGGTVEGKIYTVVDGGVNGRVRKKELSLGRVSVDVLGVEEASAERKSMFLTLSNELIDIDHPPPANMLAPSTPSLPPKLFWTLMPSTSVMPFRINLPLNVGPTTFQSKQLRIRYVLCVTMLIKVADKQYFVRQSRDIALISVFDPEKVLVSLPTPLTAFDEHILRRGGGSESIKVTAGMHRQTWTPASTLGRTAYHLRISDGNEKKVIANNVIKKGTSGWNGVDPWSSDLRTCDVEVPRGYTSIKSGKYFEVRFLLNVLVSSGFPIRHLVTVQLPVVIIHMNSLDVLPNSVGQVAAAIDGKREHRSRGARKYHSRQSQSSHSVQGRAFSAARKHSLSRLTPQTVTSNDIRDLTNILDGSPRKVRKARSLESHHTQSNWVGDYESGGTRGHRNLHQASSATLRGPKLRAGTSGIGFTNSSGESETSPDFFNFRFPAKPPGTDPAAESTRTSIEAWRYGAGRVLQKNA
ncbi:MAG: hypothetical protein M1827_004840 [Pycnora praestabilis]|nr:MAG: hypothetical protein M1827_004840 [Pycnora praestabilis]